MEVYLDLGDIFVDEGFLRFCLVLWVYKKFFLGVVEGLFYVLKGRFVGRIVFFLGLERVRGVYISWRLLVGDS